MPIRVLITGCRNWDCQGIATRVLGLIIDRYCGDSDDRTCITIVHGNAPGVDTAFRCQAEDYGLNVESYPAEWNRYGNGAGPRRNQVMVNLGADFAIAVHRNLKSSKGTRDCVRRCLAAGISVWLIDSEDAEPRRITDV